jgi:predicted membrane protein
MENQLNNNPKHTTNTKTITGIVLLGLGLLILLKHISFFIFPAFVFSWPVILIIVGLCIGAKHNFKKSGWIILTMLGVLFLLPNIIPALSIGLLWPVLIIAIGIKFIIRRDQRWNGDHWERRDDKQQHSF